MRGFPHGRAAQALGLGLRGWAAARRELEQIGLGAREALGFGPAEVEHPPPLEAIELPPPRLEPPAALAPICSSDPFERVTHAYGKAYRDLVRALRGRYDHPPDVVARPRRRGRAPAGARLVRLRGRRRHPLRRRDQRGRRGRAARAPGRRGDDRPRPVGPRARGRPRLARRPHPGGRHRARAGGAAEGARADAAPLPAVVRARHAGRLDRDARRAATSPRCTRTSTTSSSPSGR